MIYKRILAVAKATYITKLPGPERTNQKARNQR